MQSAVNVNGYLSSFFGLSRGVRQGCPLSPLLYVLEVLYVLAVNIRCNPRISSLCLPGAVPLSPISQYADDTSLILTSDDAIIAVFETYALFEQASGSKLNQSKGSGWVAGVVVWTLRSLWTGRPLSSRSFVSSSVWVIWRLKIGAPGLMLWNVYSIPGVLALFRFVARPWLLRECLCKSGPVDFA